MKLLLQRVTKAHVEVDNKVIGKIGDGLLVYVGIHRDDTIEDINRASNKILNLQMLRVIKDQPRVSVTDAKKELLIISQFTLEANTKKGYKPSYSKAMTADLAEPLYDHLVNQLKASGLKVETGIFGAYMIVSSTTPGPMNILWQS